jgi:hypothetical protein
MPAPPFISPPFAGRFATGARPLGPLETVTDNHHTPRGRVITRRSYNGLEFFDYTAVVCALIDAQVAIISISTLTFAPGAGLPVANTGTMAIPDVRHATWRQS